MLRNTKYNEMIQNLLDQCEKWSGGERVGRFYQIGQFPFVKDGVYSDIECEVLYDMAVSSELFEEGKEIISNYRDARIKLTKEGYLCVSKHGWNYKKYLYAKKAEKRDFGFKILLALIAFLFGVMAMVTREWLTQKEPIQIETQSTCVCDTFDKSAIQNTIYINSPTTIEEDSASY